MKTGKRQQRNEAIKQYIITHVQGHPRTIAKQVAQHFGVSRQTANAHLAKLMHEGILQASKGKGRKYALLIGAGTPPVERFFSFSLREPLDGGCDMAGYYQAPAQGTAVYLEMVNNTQRTAKEIHDQYASDDEGYLFAKTIVPVRMASEGEGLVSRSQAKRLLIRLDRFETVIPDFAGVEDIGQAFADEVFRVFARQHPQVRLYPINTSEAVSKMIRRALLTPEASH